MNNSINTALGHCITFPQHSSRGNTRVVFFKDKPRLVCVDLRSSIFDAYCPIQVKTAFGNRILNILFCSSKKKVDGITARWIVALVAHIKTLIEFSKCEQICEAVRDPLFGPIGNAPVSVSKGSTFPRPAFVESSNLNLAPKSKLWITPTQVSRRSTGFLVSCSLFLHKSVRLICATLSARQGARAFSFSHNSE